MKPETESWITVAEVDYRTAERVKTPPDPIPRSVFYHAQQCIEKYLKATLQEANQQMPRTHDLGQLLELTADLLPNLVALHPRIQEIAPYVVSLRYPHDVAEIPDLPAATDSALATMTATRAIITLHSAWNQTNHRECGSRIMTRPIEHHNSNEIDLGAAALSGAVAAVAYAITMEADLRLFRHNSDDLKALGRPLVGQRRRTWAKPVGAAVHLGNGVVFGAVYARFANARLPGPPWLRGVIAANIENVALYPITIFEDHHPGIRDGQIDRYWHRTAFVQSVPRHVIFGIVLGALYERLRRVRP